MDTRLGRIQRAVMQALSEAAVQRTREGLEPAATPLRQLYGECLQYTEPQLDKAVSALCARGMIEVTAAGIALESDSSLPAVRCTTDESFALRGASN